MRHTELLTFLHARLDDDERPALEADQGWYEYGTNQEIAFVSREDAAHISRHSPARVLREVAAKRRRLELHGPAVLRRGGGAYYDTITVCRTCEPPRQFPEHAYPCTTLRLEALPYADHADFKEEWQP